MSHTDDLLHLVKSLALQNTHTISVIGARSIVLTKFLDAVLPYLTTSQSVMVRHSFQQGIGEVISLMDGFRTPPAHRAALLETTNGILEALKGN